MVVVLVMDRELVELLAVKFPPAVRTDPGKELEGKGSIGRLVMRGSTP
jgi:hypothetical protein